MLGRRLRGYDKGGVRLMEATLDGLGDKFGGIIPGVDEELSPDASDDQLAQALTLCGTTFLGAVASAPPVAEKERTERKRLLRLAKEHPGRAIHAALFLTHAIANYSVLYDEVSTRWSHRLDFETDAPAPVQYRAQEALCAVLPLTAADVGFLERIGEATFGELERVIAPDQELDFQMAFGFRRGEYQLWSSVHAAEILLGESDEELQLSIENSGLASAVGTIKVGYLWKEPERTYFEILRTVAP